MFLAAGDIDLKRHTELMETYQVRGFERDLRDDLIELQTKILLNLSRIIVAYADKYGTDPELGVYPQEGMEL